MVMFLSCALFEKEGECIVRFRCTAHTHCFEKYSWNVPLFLCHMNYLLNVA